jgi:hypothetical protein
MSDRDLALALLRLDATDLIGITDVRQLTSTILERDRRRVRRLTRLTFLIWLLAAGMILIGLINYGLVMPRQAQLLQEHAPGKPPAAGQNELLKAVLVPFEVGTLLLAFSVALMAMAALFTFLLLLTSRQATLRQVSASLIDISEQLRQLRPLPPSATAPGSMS